MSCDDTEVLPSCRRDETYKGGEGDGVPHGVGLEWNKLIVAHLKGTDEGRDLDLFNLQVHVLQRQAREGARDQGILTARAVYIYLTCTFPFELSPQVPLLHFTHLTPRQTSSSLHIRQVHPRRTDANCHDVVQSPKKHESLKSPPSIYD